MATRKTALVVVSNLGFPEAEAHAFARFFRARTGQTAEVSRLFTPIENQPTDWWLVSVAPRQLARAEDLRAAWVCGRAFHDDERYAATIDAWTEHDAKRIEAGSVRVVGLTAAEREFLAAAGDPAREVSGFDAGPSTVARAKKLGYVAPEVKGNRTIYRLTEAGRTILRETA